MLKTGVPSAICHIPFCKCGLPQVPCCKITLAGAVLQDCQGKPFAKQSCLLRKALEFVNCVTLNEANVNIVLGVLVGTGEETCAARQTSRTIMPGVCRCTRHQNGTVNLVCGAQPAPNTVHSPPINCKSTRFVAARPIYAPAALQARGPLTGGCAQQRK